MLMRSLFGNYFGSWVAFGIRAHLRIYLFSHLRQTNGDVHTPESSRVGVCTHASVHVCVLHGAKAF